jgi:hypothetical protein
LIAIKKTFFIAIKLTMKCFFYLAPPAQTGNSTAPQAKQIRALRRREIIRQALEGRT